MSFIKLGEKYYNNTLIGWTAAIEKEGSINYYVQFVGGAQLEISEAEYDEIKNSGGGGGSVVNADNGVLGIIEGTYSPEATENTIINIQNGKILDIWIKDGSSYEDVRNLILGNKSAISDHVDNTSNPHHVTASQVGAYTSEEVDTLINGVSGRITNIEDILPSGSSSSNKLVDKSYVDTADSGLSSRITAIENVIPSDATASNQLADKTFVNDAVNNISAYYITKNAAGDPFRTKTELDAATTYYSGGVERVPTQNDYLYVQYDETHSETVSGYDSFTTTADYVGYYVIYNYASILVTATNKDTLNITPGTTIAYLEVPSTRYIRSGNIWSYQFIVNNTGFNADQMAAINSGITANTLAGLATKNYVDTLIGDINTILEGLL